MHSVYSGMQPKVDLHTKNATIPLDSLRNPLYSSPYKAICGVHWSYEVTISGHLIGYSLPISRGKPLLSQRVKSTALPV